MNGEEVVEMIDAITEGKLFAHRWPGETGAGLNAAFTETGLAFHADGFSCDSPRTAREIAAALVAWANNKDGIIFDQLTAVANLAAMRKQGWLNKPATKAMDTEKIIALMKAIKAETMDASVWDEDEDSPMRRIGRIDDAAYEILKELGEAQ